MKAIFELSVIPLRSNGDVVSSLVDWKLPISRSCSVKLDLGQLEV